MLKAGAVQWEVLSQQSTSSESNQRDRKSRGRLQAVGVILKWLHAKCSGIDGFKFRPQRPQNDKVRGRGGVFCFQKFQLFGYLSRLASPPPHRPSHCTERSAHHHPINHMSAGPKYSRAWRRSWKRCSRLGTHVVNYTMQHGNLVVSHCKSKTSVVKRSFHTGQRK